MLNGSWDTSNEIPNIVAEMHNVNIEELKVLQNTCSNKQIELLTKNEDYVASSPKDNDSGIEVDCSEGNLSWLLNYKINELPPVPGKKPSPRAYFSKIFRKELVLIADVHLFGQNRNLLTVLVCFVNNRLVI